jgi:hypothetical protein
MRVCLKQLNLGDTGRLETCPTNGGIQPPLPDVPAKTIKSIRRFGSVRRTYFEDSRSALVHGESRNRPAVAKSQCRVLDTLSYGPDQGPQYGISCNEGVSGQQHQSGQRYRRSHADSSGAGQRDEPAARQASEIVDFEDGWSGHPFATNSHSKHPLPAS